MAVKLTKRGEDALMYAGLIVFFIVYGVVGWIEYGG